MKNGNLYFWIRIGKEQKRIGKALEKTKHKRNQSCNLCGLSVLFTIEDYGGRFFAAIVEAAF